MSGMEIRPQTDNEIAAEERRRMKRLPRFVAASFLFWMAVAFALVVAFNFGLPQSVGAWAGIPSIVIAWVPLIILVGVWIVFLIYRRRLAPSSESLRPGVQRRLVDDYTRRQRTTLAGLIPLTLYLAYTQRNVLAEPFADAWFTQSAFVLYMMMVALALTLGVGFLSRRFRAANNDELSRALRASATRIGYLLAVAAMGAIYILYRFTPQSLGLAIPYLMAGVFIVPAIYLLRADRQASRDG